MRPVTWSGALCLGAVLCGAGSAHGQVPARVVISGAVGVAGGGPAREVEDVFTAAGLNDFVDESDAFFGESTQYPVSETLGAWSLDVRVRVRPRVSIGVSLNGTTNGSTDGYKEGGDFFDGYAPVSYTAEYSTRSIAPVINWHPSPRLRLGGGPAWHRLRYTGGFDSVRISENRVGLLAQAGYAWVDGRRLFSEITAQYQTGSSIDVPSATVSAEGYQGVTTTLIIPSTSISYAQWSVGVSFGVKVR